jgi:hypothetical protein
LRSHGSRKSETELVTESVAVIRRALRPISRMRSFGPLAMAGDALRMAIRGTSCREGLFAAA